MPELFLPNDREILKRLVLPDDLIRFVSSLPLPSLDDSSNGENARQQLGQLIENLRLENTLSASGLWLLIGELDRSHKISQQFESADGSFWHAIMHRREGDYWNSKYWFRRVGDHPVHHSLAQLISSEHEFLSGTGVPLHALSVPSSLGAALVDITEQAVHGKRRWREPLELIGWWEWLLLFVYTYTN